jgi:hypothetical protein
MSLRVIWFLAGEMPLIFAKLFDDRQRLLCMSMQISDKRLHCTHILHHNKFNWQRMETVQRSFSLSSIRQKTEATERRLVKEGNGGAEQIRKKKGG